MENPTFKLEGIVKVRDDMEDFEGPLTLILQLLSKNKIEIKDIQISSLLDQYLEYLDEMKSMDLEIASEFVTMASYLVYIKTKMLLNIGEEEVSELDELISTLEAMKSRDTYMQIKGVVDNLQNMFKRGGATYTKPPEPLKIDNTYTYIHKKEDLLLAMARVYENQGTASLTSRQRPFVMPKRIMYSVSAKSREIIDLLKRTGIMKLSSLYFSANTVTELVATFISVLEMCKDGRVSLSGDENDLMISHTGIEFADEEMSEYDGEVASGGNS